MVSPYTLRASLFAHVFSFALLLTPLLCVCSLCAGLGSTIMREAMKDTSADRHWVVFDGPVDALWIENMNTVLDDNMTLSVAHIRKRVQSNEEHALQCMCSPRLFVCLFSVPLVQLFGERRAHQVEA